MSISERLNAVRDQRVSFAAPAQAVAPAKPLDPQVDGLVALKARAVDLLFERMGHRLNDSTLSDVQLRGFVREELSLIIEEERLLFTGEEKNRLIGDIEDDALGLGPIQRLLDDREVTEIMVNGHTNIYVERNGKLVASTRECIRN